METKSQPHPTGDELLELGVIYTFMKILLG